MSGPELLLIGAAVALVLFTLTWVLSISIHNYGFLDVVWSLSIGVLAAMCSLLGSGDATRRWLFGVAGVVWSFRLGGYILVRVWGEHPVEDRRYGSLRRRWPGRWRFLLFFELQAAIAVVFCLPFLLAAVNGSPSIGLLEIGGLVIAVSSTAGEALADFQARRWKRDPRNRAAVLNRGLWRYSRHPNYFFEFLVWVGFCLAALPSPHGWITTVCPMLMLYFLLCVTGIPLTEKYSLESRGDAYREYQRATSKFVPWFPRR